MWLEGLVDGVRRGSTDEWDIVSGVGITALAVASGRAIESTRPDPLIVDPYAAWFLAEAQPPVPMPDSADDPEVTGSPQGGWAAASRYIAVRSRAFDDYLQDAARSGIGQVVILASGLDTRAHRLDWPQGTTVFEIDQPAVLDFKLRVLRDRGARRACVHRPVPADLREDWAAALREAGFDRTRPTAWLAEGLLPYLPADAEERLFAEIHRLSAPGSRLAVEQVQEVEGAVAATARASRHADLRIGISQLVHADPRPPADHRLSAMGWQAESVSPVDTAARYGRDLTTDSSPGRHIRHAFAHLPAPGAQRL
ncbi:SAM-dependent methyltransferase [Streptomyces orinoci]|uniref:S-adenosyl-L-methionine-dependent methyltransferase n=1 Tax=Streptomyces orinoci TaxID=67339 RepID=A0ABV3K9E2_STRON|nr:SAM-dependent methyltransferase [Streptomyces orinoci]